MSSAVLTRTSTPVVATPLTASLTRAARPPRPLAPAPSRRPARPVRLTRRGRVVIVLGMLAALVVGLSSGHLSSQAASHAGSIRPHTVTVQAGETLWQVAARIAPHVDPRLVVDQIERLNHLPGPQLMAGQQLVVPVSR